MGYNRRKTTCGLIILLSGAFCSGLPFAASPRTLPKGLMLNLDFQGIESGLIPNKTLYPLYVPLGALSFETVNHRNILAVQYGQGLDIPHSSLLNPDGSEWIVSTRIFALSDGIVLSQTDGKTGYVIYINDGVVQAAINTGGATFKLKESEKTGITDCLKNWTSIELRIKPERAMMLINRKWAAMTSLDLPYSGTAQRIPAGNPIGTARPPLSNSVKTQRPMGLSARSAR